MRKFGTGSSSPKWLRCAPRLRDGQEVLVGKHVGRADGHQLDEAQQQSALAGVFDERDELFLVAAAHEHAVELDLVGGEPGVARGLDPLQGRRAENRVR